MQAPKNVKNDKNGKEDIIINKEAGAGTPLATPPGLHYLPDGRSYIEPLFFYTKADFNGLPTDKNIAVRSTLMDVKRVELEPERVSSLWESFKELELTFQKPYRNKDEVYKHFSNWINKKAFNKGAAPRKSKVVKGEKIIGIEFINDFKQVRLSDGTVQELSTNESDSAKYNGLKPQSILKH